VTKPLRINLDAAHHDLLLKVRQRIVERNKQRSVDGEYRSFEGWTFKDIIQRGIGLVAADVDDGRVI
jgi:hypothetical protein